MGNGQSGSVLDRISIDEDPILVDAGGSWNLHHGRDNETRANLSVYVGSKPGGDGGPQNDFNVVHHSAQVQLSQIDPKDLLMCCISPHRI